MSDDTKAPEVNSAQAALDKLDQITKSLAAMETRGTVTQTVESAFEQERRAVAEERAKLEAERKSVQGLLAGWQETYAQIRRDFDAQRTAQPDISTRATVPSMREAGEIMRHEMHIPKAETKSFYARMAHNRTQRSGLWSYADTQSAHPLDIVVRGAYIPTTKGLYGDAQPLIVKDEAIDELRKLNDALIVWRWVKALQNGGMAPAWQQSPFWPAYQATLAKVSRALDTTDTANWVPTGWSTSLLERYELADNLTPQLNTFVMPRSPFDLPVLGARPVVYKFAENTADPESATAVATSDPTDLKATLALVTLAVRTAASYEVDEDSIIALAQLIPAEQGKALAYGKIDAIINGDTQGTHQDSDVTASTDRRKAWDGLRRMAIANSYSTDGSAYTSVTFKNMIKSMGVYGSKADTFWIMGLSSAANLLTLTDGTNPMTAGNAVAVNTPYVITNGEVSAMWGRPVVVTEAMRQDLNASGVYDGTTTTKTAMLLVNRQGFVLGYTSASPTIETDRVIRMRQMEIVTAHRLEFEDTYAIASNKTVWYDYNIAS